MNRDLAIGVAFFALMGVCGALLVWLNWRKVSVDQLRKDQRSQVSLLAHHLGMARANLEQAKHASEPKRKEEFARQALNAYTAAIGIKDDDSLLWSERAEAELILGDKGAARRHLDQARRLEPSRDWSDLEKRLSP